MYEVNGFIALLAGASAGTLASRVVEQLPGHLKRQWYREAIELLDCSELSDNDAEDNVVSTPKPQEARWFTWVPVIGLAVQCWRERSEVVGRYWYRVAAESLGGLMALAVVGTSQMVGLDSAAIYIACMVLLTLALIDCRTYLLPDLLTIPLLWSGLLYQVLIHPLQLKDAVIGAATGYLAPRLLSSVTSSLTGKDGMGRGDFKLLAALGAWLGWQVLPGILGLATCLALVWAVLHRLTRESILPFGPFLAVAGCVALIGAEHVERIYYGILMVKNY